MKKILALLLTLVILLSVAPSVGTVADAAVKADPYIAMNWGKVTEGKYDNIAKAYVIEVKNIGGQIQLGSGNYTELAKTVKTALDKLPEGMQYIRLFKPSVALTADAKYVIYADGGVKQLKKQFDAFIKAYHDIGGKLDGIILDVEYVNMGSWYLYTSGYGGVYKKDIKNKNFYNEIVAHPQYAKEIRPMLEERGFVFYEKVGGDKAEIWSIFPYQYLSGSKYPTYDKNYAKYASCTSIWNQVMDDRIAMYFNYALYEPMKALYPNATMSDYQVYEGDPWYKNLQTYTNGMKIGNVSNSNDYSGLPNSKYFKDGSTYLYQNPASYYEAVYDDDPYGMLLWNINKFKNIYDATDTKMISVWIAEYDYSSRAGSYKGNTAYYTESLYHYGMLDPQPFLIYFAETDGQWKNGGVFDSAKYDNRLDCISQILKELTRVAGYSDRKPIEVPANWNDGYVLSGIYANGRNIWRITPDVTGGTTLKSFKIKDKDPTFKINGTTVTFPGGKILKEGSVSTGSTGYWVETAKNVKPVVTRDTNRYSENPSYQEDYESYKAGTALTASNVALPQTWEITADKNLVVTANNGGKALALTGTAALQNVKLPKNITAGDTYARQQAWEITVTLPKAMNSGSKVVLLNTATDGGFKLEGGKIYYDDYAQYIEVPGVTLETGKKYTFKRDIDFDKGTCTYVVYEGDKKLKQVDNVDMKEVKLPVQTIGISCADLTTQVLIDDYKLYPTGLAVDLAIYDVYGGEKLMDHNKHEKAEVAYRLSWMNATAKKQTIKVKAACYDSSNNLTSETVVATVTMAPGEDGVVVGTVQNKSKKMRIYLDDGTGEMPTKPTIPEVESDFVDEEEVAPTKGTIATKATTTATKAPLTKPTRASKATTATKATKAPTVSTKPGETLAPDETVAPDATVEVIAPDETVAPEETLAPEETQDADESIPEESKDNTVILIVAVAVAVLVVAGGLTFFLLKKKKPVASATAPEAAEEPEEIEELNDDPEA